MATSKPTNDKNIAMGRTDSVSAVKDKNIAMGKNDQDADGSAEEIINPSASDSPDQITATSN